MAAPRPSAEGRRGADVIRPRSISLACRFRLEPPRHRDVDGAEGGWNDHSPMRGGLPFTQPRPVTNESLPSFERWAGRPTKTSGGRRWERKRVPPEPRHPSRTLSPPGPLRTSTSSPCGIDNSPFESLWGLVSRDAVPCPLRSRFQARSARLEAGRHREQTGQRWTCGRRRDLLHARRPPVRRHPVRLIRRECLYPGCSMAERSRRRSGLSAP